MLQPKKPLDLSSANEILNKERPPLDLSGAESILKKKEDSVSTAPKEKSALEGTKNGSSGGARNNPFGKTQDYTIQSNKVTIPKVTENSVDKERRLRAELSNIKVTASNQDAISKKTDELSQAIKANQAKQSQAKSNRVKELESAFYKETISDEDENEAEQRLQDRISGNGFVNTVSSFAKKALNTAVDFAVSANPTNIGLLAAKVDEDPLADNKKIVKAEAKKNKEKITEVELEKRARQNYKEREKDNMFVDRANSFLDNLDVDDKRLLQQDRYDKSIHLQEENLKRVKFVAAMETVGNEKVNEYKNVETQLKALQDKNQQFPKALYDKYLSLSQEIKAIGSNIEKNSNYIQKNREDLGTAQQEWDLFKRENGDFNNFAGNIAAATGEIGVGILGFVNYASSFGNPLDQVRAMKGQEVAAQFKGDMEQYRETLRKPVKSIESAEGLLNYTSDLLANQIPNLIMTSPGSAGLVGVGLVSAGQKNTEMNEDVRQGKASYSPLQMAVAPILNGGAEVLSEIPTLSILKRGGRVLEAVGRTELELVNRTAKQKAVEWAKDYGINMTKEMRGEQFTNFTQNFNDKYILGNKDVNLLDNTGRVFKDTFALTSILLIAPQTFGAIVQPFQSKNDLGTLDENARKIIDFSKQLNTDGLTDVEKTVIQKQIDKVTGESSKIVANTIGTITDMPGELYDEVVNLNSKAGEIKSQAKEINDGKLPNKKELLQGLSEEYKALQDKRQSIIDGKTSVVDVLPLKEQETLKRQAMEDLVTELNPDGKKDIKITNEQVLERATKIYNESKKNDDTTTQTSTPSSTEVATPSVSEVLPNTFTEIVGNDQDGFTIENPNRDLLQNENGAVETFKTKVEAENRIQELQSKNVVEQTTTDTNEQAAEVEPAPSVSTLNDIKIKKLEEERDGKLLLEPKGIPQEELIKTPSYINNRKIEAEYIEKINQLKNEATPSQNPPTDGDVQLGSGVVEQNGVAKQKSIDAENVPKTADIGQGEVNVEVEAVAAKAGVKAKNIRDLYKVNQEVFGQNKVKALAGAVVMDRMIGAMAKKANVSKAELYSKLDFKKGDKKTFEELSSKGKALFQIAGQNAELNKLYRDNLNRAVELEKNGKTEKEIWIATGWQKGADGKWRVEFDDSKMKLKDDYASMRGYPLSEAIEYKELFDLYPELKDVKFSVIPRLGSMKGAFMPAKNLIMINGQLSAEEVKSTLLHEIQHIIQSKEGFATGGTPKMAVDYLNTKLSRLKIAKNLPKSVVKAADKLINSLFTGIDVSKSKNQFLKEINNVKNKLSAGEWDVYQSIAGEVESRNVQNRMKMTAEDRKNTPLSETETKTLAKEYSDDPDVEVQIGRDEQIVLFQGAKGAVEIGKDGEAVIYALTDPNVSTPLHELAHVYEHYLSDSDKKTILDWSNHKEWTRETSENFAKGFEKYLADGIAPTAELQKIFEKFKEWLTDIYSGIKDSEIDLKLSPKMQDIYAGMLGEKFKTTKRITSVKNAKYDVDIDVDGNVTEIRSVKDGRIIPKFVEKTLNKGTTKERKIISVNANYSKIESDATGNVNNNQSKVERDKKVAQALDAFIPVTEEDHALQYLATGGNISLESARKEAGLSTKEVRWVTGFKKDSTLPSVEAAVENIMANASIELDSQSLRNALINIIQTGESIVNLQDEIVNLVDATNIIVQEQELRHFLGSLSEKDLAMYDAIKAEDDYISELTDEDAIKYFEKQYEPQIENSYGQEREQNPNDKIGAIKSTGVQEPNGEKENDNKEEKGITSKILNQDNVKGVLDFLDDLKLDPNNAYSTLPFAPQVWNTFIEAVKLSVKAGNTIQKAIQEGINALKNNSMSQTDIDAIVTHFNEKLNKNATGHAEKFTEIEDAINQGKTKEEILDEYKDFKEKRQAENIYNRITSENISEEDAYNEVRNAFNQARTELENKQPTKELLKKAYRTFVKRFTDRQFLAKMLLERSGFKNVKNLIINAQGASGKAKAQFQEAYDTIYKGLSKAERNNLDEIIQAKRFIAIDESRALQGKGPVTHPNFIDKNKSEKFLSQLEKELGTEKYNDLVQRAEAYFKTYKDLLTQMKDNGLISQESFDAMDADYQPRVFLQHVTDFEGNIEADKQSNQVDTGGLSSDQIKSLSDGDASSLVLNSEWLLTNSLLARSKAMAINNVNKRFMTGDFQAAKKRFEALDPKNLKGDDVRFYKYFKELNSKVIDNPIVGFTDDGNAKYQYNKTPPNFNKAYYFIEGQRHEFFMEAELHESWFDNMNHILSSGAKEFISYASGSALLKGIATGNNPAFPIVNTPRDFLFTVAFSDQYSKIVPKAMMQVGKDVVQAIREINKPQSDVLQKYMEYGGAMDFLSSQGKLKKSSVIGKAIDKAVSPRARDISKSIFDKLTLHKIAAYSEMMFRLGIFQRSIQNQLKGLGLDDISQVTDKQQLDDIYNEAVANARGILDFNQGGTVTKDLESVIPYINVAFQGGRVAATAFGKDPVGTSSRVLQVATLASAVPIGISLALISGMKGDDDEDKSAYDIYLHALDGISPYQKMKYMNIPTPFKDENGEYMVLKIAKAQELSPFMTFTDEIYNNLIRSMAGKEKKSAGAIIKSVLTTFNDNVMPIDFTKPEGLIVRNPFAKAVLTKATGYDFFRNEPLSNDVGKVPLEVEGITMKSTEEFYKKIGEKTGLSPVRTKAMVEAYITSPSTNPFVGMLYGGADAAASDKDMKTIGKDLFKTIYKSTGKRVVSYSSDFNRQLAGKAALQDKIDAINIQQYKEKAEFNKIAKQFADKEISAEDLRSKLKELEPGDRKRMVNKIKDKIRFKNVDATILDIKYEQGAAVKALMIANYYGDILDKSEDSKNVLRQMGQVKGILTPEVMYEYTKLQKELKEKTPN